MFFVCAECVNMFECVLLRSIVHGHLCVYVCCRWLEEPAASGSVRKHLIRDGVEEEREQGKKRKQRGRDDGGVAGWSAEHPSHLLPTSLLVSSFLCSQAKAISSKYPLAFIIHCRKRGLFHCTFSLLR